MNKDAVTNVYRVLVVIVLVYIAVLQKESNALFNESNALSRVSNTLSSRSSTQLTLERPATSVQMVYVTNKAPLEVMGTVSINQFGEIPVKVMNKGLLGDAIPVRVER